MRRAIALLLIMSILAVCAFGRTLWRKGQRETKGKEKDMRKELVQEGLYVPTTREIRENSFIYRYNHKLCREKRLIEGDSLGSYYLCLQAIYRANLDALLLEKLDIRSLEEEFQKSKLGFVCRRQEDKELYEKESAMGLKFISLGNNLYIEYLEEEQLNLLEEKLGTGKPFVTDELQAMAEETYQEVIRVRNPGRWEEKSTFLYPEGQGRKPKIPSQALVLKISNVMEYDASGNLILDEHMREKCEYLEQLKDEKEKEYSEILGIDVYILLD